MFEVYEVYGSRAGDIRNVRSLLSPVLGVEFKYHESYYKGEYFLAAGLSGQELTIESNWLEDEEGRFCRETEFPEFETLVYFEYRTLSWVNDGPAPDELSRKLGNVEFLDLLRRDFVPAGK
jgi:hypothetical protein